MSACIRDEYYRLLKEWLDALLACMVNDPVHPSVDGAILCPACTIVHGRCHEAVYPLTAMAEFSGEAKYLDAARKLFRWSSWMLCDDGSMYNDSQSAWNGTTVFGAISLFHALPPLGWKQTHAHRPSQGAEALVEPPGADGNTSSAPRAQALQGNLDHPLNTVGAADS
jgi:hypothetical protein